MQVWRTLTLPAGSIANDSSNTSSFCSWIRPRASAILNLGLYNQDPSSSALAIGLLASSLEEVRIYDDDDCCTVHQLQLLVDLLGICCRLRLVSIRSEPDGDLKLALHQLSQLPSLRDLTVNVPLQTELVSLHCSGLTSLSCDQLLGRFSALASLSSLVRLKMSSYDTEELPNLSSLSALTKLKLLQGSENLTLPVQILAITLQCRRLTHLTFAGPFHACRLRKLKILVNIPRSPVLAEKTALQGLTSLTKLSFGSSYDMPALNPTWSALQHLKELQLGAAGTFHSLQAFGASLPPGLPSLSCRCTHSFTLNLQAICRLTALEELNIRCMILTLEDPIVDVLRQLSQVPTVSIYSQTTRLF